MLDETDPAMQRAKDRFDKSQMSLDDLGMKLGYPKESARKSAWQFLYKTIDPRLSMLRRFAEAVGCSVKSLLGSMPSGRSPSEPIRRFLTVDRAQHFIRLLGWSSGDVADTDGTWLVACRRDDETIIARAKSQRVAWNLALQQVGKVQRGG